MLDDDQPGICHAIVLITRFTASRQTVPQCHDYGLSSSYLVIYLLDQDKFVYVTLAISKYKKVFKHVLLLFVYNIYNYV